MRHANDEIHQPADALTVRSVDEVELGLRLPIVAILQDVAHDPDDLHGGASCAPDELWNPESNDLAFG